ncbi:hypothetical protein [Streptomyces sp. G45]|uniref:hypothetical protein n=1 Tax=Streptomyces sp. G45 TaxID=3406627 RepID=UPI003C1A8259
MPPAPTPRPSARNAPPKPNQTVTYGGDPELWKQAEAALNWWNTHHRPTHDQFGYVREADGGAFVWHVPDGTRWHLAAR